ncbi:nucleotide exchange factor GrpE [Candidatus Parcubacteria bacterium]|nr:nucleotide exchange factor GrpE [Candidatus Parcubacteria bacterium]
MKDKNQDTKTENDEIVDEEIVFEKDVDIDADYTEKDPKIAIQKLKEKIAVALKDKAEYLDGWQRAKADFINTRKRDEEMYSNLVKFANKNLITEIIPVLDSFDMAMQNKEAWEKSPKEWRIGVEYIYSQLLDILQKNGLKQFDPLGQDFDPQFHEALDTVETKNVDEDGKVFQVLQKGYSLNDKPIRSAKVKISKSVS